MIRICKQCASEWEDEKKSSLCPACRSKLGKRSKNKGSANERRFAEFLNGEFKKYGFPYVAKRTPRSGGIQDFEPSDIMFRFLPPSSLFAGIHFENKNTAQWDIVGWMEYAASKEHETGRGRKPVLIIRKPNMREEYAVLKMEHLVEMLISLEKFLHDGTTK